MRGKFTTPWVREGLPSPFEREVANLGACSDSSKSSHAKQATAWPCLKLTVSPSPSLRFVVSHLYQTISRNCLARGWRAGADICRYLEWHGTGRQAGTQFHPSSSPSASWAGGLLPSSPAGWGDGGGRHRQHHHHVLRRNSAAAQKGDLASLVLLEHNIHMPFILLTISEPASQLYLLQCTSCTGCTGCTGCMYMFHRLYKLHRLHLSKTPRNSSVPIWMAGIIS